MEKANVLAALNDARDALDALISNEKTIEAVVAAASHMDFYDYADPHDKS